MAQSCSSRTAKILRLATGVEINQNHLSLSKNNVEKAKEFCEVVTSNSTENIIITENSCSSIENIASLETRNVLIFDIPEVTPIIIYTIKQFYLILLTLIVNIILFNT